MVVAGATQLGVDLLLVRGVEDVLVLMSQREAAADLRLEAVELDAPGAALPAAVSRVAQYVAVLDQQAWLVGDYGRRDRAVGDAGQFQQPGGLQLGPLKCFVEGECSHWQEVAQYAQMAPC